MIIEHKHSLGRAAFDQLNGYVTSVSVQYRRKGANPEIILIVFYTGRTSWRLPGTEQRECCDLTCLRQGRQRIGFRRRIVADLPYAALRPSRQVALCWAPLAARASILRRAIPCGRCSRIWPACRRATGCGK